MGLFRITGVEATQSIQNFSSPPLQGTSMGAADNSVPLVADRRTILRVYVGDARPGSLLFAYMLYGSSAPFGPSPARYSNQIVTPPMPPDRRRTDHTMQIDLPPQSPGSQACAIHVVEIDPTYTLPPREATPLLVTLNFQERRLVRIRLVRIHYRGRGLDVAPRSVQEFWNALDIPQRVLPVRMPGFQIVSDSVEVYDGDFTQISPAAHDTSWSGYAGNKGTTGSLLNILDGLAATEGLPADVIYVGIYPPGVNQSPWAGWAVGRWIISDLNGMTLAHELAHKLCVPLHAPCGGPAAVDPAFPMFGGLPAASIGDVGFDPSTLVTYDPAAVKDLMSYCDPKWISAYNYQKVFQCLAPLPPPPRPPSGPFELPDTIPLVLVKFPPDQWIKVELPHLPRTPWPWPPNEDGPVLAKVFDRRGRELASTSGPIGPSSSDLEQNDARIELNIPWPRGAERVEVRFDKRVVWKHTDAGKSPVLSVRWPSARSLRGGAGRITWEISGRADHVVVRASRDGGETWSSKVLAGSARGLDLDRGLLGQGADCRLEVSAVRGFRAARVESKPFSVEPVERPLMILLPRDGEEIESGAHSRFEAISSDSRAAVEWHSDRDGPLGRGAFLLVPSLSPGAHLIEARSDVPFEGPAHVRLTVKGVRAKRQPRLPGPML